MPRARQIGDKAKMSEYMGYHNDTPNMVMTYTEYISTLVINEHLGTDRRCPSKSDI